MCAVNVRFESRATPTRQSFLRTKLYYRILRGGTSPFLGPSELWVADPESGHSEALVPGFAVTPYGIDIDSRKDHMSAVGREVISGWPPPTVARPPDKFRMLKAICRFSDFRAS